MRVCSDSCFRDCTRMTTKSVLVVISEAWVGMVLDFCAVGDLPSTVSYRAHTLLQLVISITYNRYVHIHTCLLEVLRSVT